AYGLGGGKGRKPKPIPRPKAPKKKEKKNRLDVSRTRVDELLFAPRLPSATTVEMEGKGEQG
ncbi:MAG: hypothetical protein MR735_03565, partial [Collinsella sp.]|nr:hypothetical protein [Collinsella sp.]